MTEHQITSIVIGLIGFVIVGIVSYVWNKLKRTQAGKPTPEQQKESGNTL